MSNYVRGIPRFFRDGKPFLSFDPQNDDPILESLAKADVGDAWVYPEARMALVDDYKKPLLTAGNMPIGAVVHYTESYSIESTIRSFRENKLGSHLVVGPTGEVVQFYKLNHQAMHVGPSIWDGKDQLDRYYMGIEVVSLGAVREVAEGCYVDAYNREYKGVVRECRLLENDFWAMITEVQAQSLVDVLCWAIQKFRFRVQNVLGHYEVSPGKIDPGGVAWWGDMSHLRNHLRGLLKNCPDLY